MNIIKYIYHSVRPGNAATNTQPCATGRVSLRPAAKSTAHICIYPTESAPGEKTNSSSRRYFLLSVRRSELLQWNERKALDVGVVPRPCGMAGSMSASSTLRARPVCSSH